TRHADDQAVAADEERLQHQLDDVALADDAFAELGDHLLPAVLHLVGKCDVVGGVEIRNLSFHIRPFAVPDQLLSFATGPHPRRFTYDDASPQSASRCGDAWPRALLTSP